MKKLLLFIFLGLFVFSCTEQDSMAPESQESDQATTIPDQRTEVHPNSWVISRVLSASWVAEYPEDAKAILQELSSKSGTSSQVKSAVDALVRHGVNINIS